MHSIAMHQFRRCTHVCVWLVMLLSVLSTDCFDDDEKLCVSNGGEDYRVCSPVQLHDTEYKSPPQTY